MKQIPLTPVAICTDGAPLHKPSPLSVMFLSHLIGALGVAALMTGCDLKDSDSGDDATTYAAWYDCTPTTTTRTTKLSLYPEEEECSESPPIEELLYKEYYYHDCRDILLLTATESICTYEVTCEHTTCCYGRPYLDASGEAVLSDVTEREDWRKPVNIDVAVLSEEDRKQLAAFWLHSAQAEHSSVAGFHRFALDLLAHGAPPELVQQAQQAAAQETAHAIACFSLASAYAGKGYGPAPMNLGQQAPVASSLAELAAWTLRDGAIGETIAAYGVAASLERTTDPIVRAMLERLVEEELEHAELAWKTLAWALDVGGQDVRDTLRAVFNNLTTAQEPPERSTPTTIAHGILPPEQRNAATLRCIEEVLAPTFASLMATALAA